MIEQFLLTLGTLLSPFQVVSVIEPGSGRPKKEKDASNLCKEFMREPEEAEFITYHYNRKW